VSFQPVTEQLRDGCEQHNGEYRQNPCVHRFSYLLRTRHNSTTRTKMEGR
jgi:hypothetical protein